MSQVEHYRFLMEYAASRWLRLDLSKDRGAIGTTEIAVLTFLVVGIATAVAVILIAKGRSNAESIPDSVPAPG